jgi:Kdo2-lipid IVA lauroyltransferase/acyltransferase
MQFELITYVAAQVALASLRASSLATARRMGKAVGHFAYAADRTRRQCALDALAYAFPAFAAAERAAIARRSFETVFRTIAEIAWCAQRSPAERASLVRYESADVIDRLIAAGRMPILFSAHAGNWEIGASAFGPRFGPPVVAIAKHISNLRINDLVVHTRRRMGLETIDHRRSLAVMSRLLAHGSAIAVVVDQYSRSGQVVRSFGRPVCFSRGPAILARRTGAPLVPFICRANGDGFVARFLEPLEPAGCSTEALVDRMSGVIDAIIVERPEEWLWFHRRWRDLPAHGIRIDEPGTWPRVIDGEKAHPV